MRSIIPHNADKRTHGQPCTQTDGQVDMQAEMQTDRQTGKPAHRQIHRDTQTDRSQNKDVRALDSLTRKHDSCKFGRMGGKRLADACMLGIMTGTSTCRASEARVDVGNGLSAGLSLANVNRRGVSCPSITTFCTGKNQTLK